MSIQINPMSISEYREVYDLWDGTPGIGLSSSDEENEIAAFLEHNPGLSLVAREGDKLAGAVLCGHDGRRGYIHHLAIAESFRRTGIGGVLIERCLAALREIGISEVSPLRLPEQCGSCGVLGEHRLDREERPFSHVAVDRGMRRRQ